MSDLSPMSELRWAEVQAWSADFLEDTCVAVQGPARVNVTEFDAITGYAWLHVSGWVTFIPDSRQTVTSYPPTAVVSIDWLKLGWER